MCVDYHLRIALTSFMNNIHFFLSLLFYLLCVCVFCMHCSILLVVVIWASFLFQLYARTHELFTLLIGPVYIWLQLDSNWIGHNCPLCFSRSRSRIIVVVVIVVWISEQKLCINENKNRSPLKKVKTRNNSRARIFYFVCVCVCVCVLSGWLKKSAREIFDINNKYSS